VLRGLLRSSVAGSDRGPAITDINMLRFTIELISAESSDPQSWKSNDLTVEMFLFRRLRRGP
jgi:hypothetical protein